MTGATAATAAGVTASQAGLVTINLTNNYISGPGGNHLNADLTGDGHPDLTIANASNGTFHNPYDAIVYYAGVSLNGIRAFALWNFYSRLGHVRLGSKFVRFSSYPTYPGIHSLTGSIPIFFKDLHINGGTPTEGSLEVTVSGPNSEIQLDSFTYNSNTPVDGLRSAVPDQESSLALLAMGAGGILALRRWRTG
jgi:hypothetical protein